MQARHNHRAIRRGPQLVRCARKYCSRAYEQRCYRSRHSCDVTYNVELQRCRYCLQLNACYWRTSGGMSGRTAISLRCNGCLRCRTRARPSVIATYEDGSASDIAIPTVSSCFTSSFSEDYDANLLGSILSEEEFGVVLVQANAILHRHGIGRTPPSLLVLTALLPPLALLCCAVRSCMLEDAARRALLDVHVYLAVDVTQVFKAAGRSLTWSLDFADTLDPEDGSVIERRWFVRLRLGTQHNVSARGGGYTTESLPTPRDEEEGPRARAARGQLDGSGSSGDDRSGASRPMSPAMPPPPLSAHDIAILRSGSTAASEVELDALEASTGDPHTSMATSTATSTSPGGTAHRPNPLVTVVLQGRAGIRANSPRGGPTRSPVAWGGTRDKVDTQAASAPLPSGRSNAAQPIPLADAIGSWGTVPASAPRPVAKRASAQFTPVNAGDVAPPASTNSFTTALTAQATSGTVSVAPAAAGNADTLASVRRDAAAPKQAWRDTAGGPGVDGVLMPARSLIRSWRVSLLRGIGVGIPPQTQS